MLAKELRGGEVICLCGDLGAGKTTFTQGILKGLDIKGPYTSPTFVVIKQYKGNSKKNAKLSLKNAYHIDAYRISSKDILELGFKDFAGKENCITIVEWPENIQEALPHNALWIRISWINKKERHIEFSTK